MIGNMLNEELNKRHLGVDLAMRLEGNSRKADEDFRFTAVTQLPRQKRWHEGQQ